MFSLLKRSTSSSSPSSSVSSSSLKRFQILSVSKLILLSSSTRLLSTSSSASASASTAFAFQVSPTTVKQFRPLQYQQYQQYQQFQPFHSSTFIPTKSTMMDEQQEHAMFSNLSARRITSLFSRSSSAMDVDETSTGNTNGSGKDFSTKNKKNELKRLAKTMDVEVSKVKELLKRQQSKLEPNSDKGQYVNWLLSNDRKKKTSSTALADKRKRSDSNTTTNGNSAPGIENKKPNEKKSKTIRPQKPSSKSSSSMNDDSANENNASSGKNSNLHSSTKFKDQNMHPNTKKAITNLMKHEYMTDIQSETYLAASKGTDVLGRARTGTGKTLAFLIPALERLLSSNAIYTPGKNVGVLIISPTRELATQIGDQAEKLLTYHKGLSCQVMFGGTKMGRDVNMLNKRLPTVLVATPGRLLDHLENTKISGRKFGYDIMTDTPLLVLDEADRLLDMGFKREIEKIMSYLPRQEKRQTLLFSATVPKELKRIMSDNMRPDYIEVDCIGGDGSTEFVDEQHTNVLVQQSHVVLPSLDRYVTSVVEIVKHSMQDRDHKLVVFFPTARLVGFFAELFNLGLGIEVIELHSRKTQGYRNTASEKFRKAKTGILFTSDVSARGVDYPNVSGVIQFGLPESRDQYIHRLGRTGRAGKDGKGIIVLAPYEAKFIGELKDIDIPADKEITQILQNPVDQQIMGDLNVVFNRIRSGDAKLTLSAQQAYQAFIGYYRGQMKRTTIRNNQQLVDVANEYSRLMGLKEIPGLTKRAAGKMGLKGLPNVRIVDEVRGGGGRGGRGGGRGGRGGGRGGRGRR